MSRVATDAERSKAGVVPAQRTPSDDEIDPRAATVDEDAATPTAPADPDDAVDDDHTEPDSTDADTSGTPALARAGGPDTPGVVATDSAEPDTPTASASTRASADPAPTLVSTAAGPADAITPARPHPVRAIAKVAATGLGSDPANRRRRVVAVVLSLIVVLAGVVWVVTRDADIDGPRNPAQGNANPQVSATEQVPTAAPSSDPPTPTTAPPAAGGDATPEPGGERPALPGGWREYTDSTGFSLYVPANWRVSREGTMVYFRGDGRVLGIDQTDQPRSDPVADWRGQAAARVSAGDFPNYHEIRIEAVQFWQKAADWEFTYGSGGRRTHVNNRGVVVSSHKAYGFWWQTPDAEWDGALPDLQLIFASFRPAPAALD